MEEGAKMKNDLFIDFGGKTVVVTGASSGIGRAISVELSNRGAGLVLVGRAEEKLNETYKLLSPGRHHVVPLDLMDYPEISPALWTLRRETDAFTGCAIRQG